MPIWQMLLTRGAGGFDVDDYEVGDQVRVVGDIGRYSRPGSDGWKRLKHIGIIDGVKRMSKTGPHPARAASNNVD